MFSRGFGIFSFIAGLLGAIFFSWLKSINKPVKVTTVLGTGYMTNGWGDVEVLFDIFIVLGIVLAILGLITIIFPKKPITGGKHYV